MYGLKDRGMARNGAELCGSGGVSSGGAAMQMVAGEYLSDGCDEIHGVCGR